MDAPKAPPQKPLQFSELGQQLGGLIAGYEFLYGERPEQKKARPLPEYVTSHFQHFYFLPSFFRVDRAKQFPNIYPDHSITPDGVGAFTDVLHQELRQYSGIVGDMLATDKLPKPAQEAIKDYDAVIRDYQLGMSVIYGHDPRKAAAHNKQHVTSVLAATIEKLQKSLTDLGGIPLRVGNQIVSISNKENGQPIRLHGKFQNSCPALVVFGLSRNAKAMIDKSKIPEAAFKFQYSISGFETDITDAMRELWTLIPAKLVDDPKSPFPNFHENKINTTLKRESHDLWLFSETLEALGAPEQPVLYSLRQLLKKAQHNPNIERIKNGKEAAILLYAVRQSFKETIKPFGKEYDDIYMQLGECEQALSEQKTLRSSAGLMHKHPEWEKAIYTMKPWVEKVSDPQRQKAIKDALDFIVSDLSIRSNSRENAR